MPTYDYRRELNAAERSRALAVGVAVGAGAAVVAAYLAGIMMQRAPLGGAVVLDADRRQPMPRVSVRRPLPR